MSASTTRAPSSWRRPTHASAASLASVSRPSPRTGARRRSPTTSPSRRGSGTGPPGEHRPQRRSVRDRAGEGADRVERRAQRVDAVDRDRPEPCLQPDELARGGGQPDRAARVRADPQVAEPGRDRRGVPAGRAAGRPARAGRGCEPCRRTRSCPRTPQANSARFAFPRIVTPASSARWTTVAWRVGTWSAYTREPYVVRIPAVSIRSLTTRVRPASGPADAPSSGSSSHVIPAFQRSSGALTPGSARRRRPRCARRGSRAPTPRRGSRRDGRHRRPPGAPG